ncbi:MAG TPA: divalent-cation tolerance protein CutA [Chloroflexi bacterium]|nr:divalent-cation tolerance protein CutA [Chloroflexota bacterium]
MLIKTTSMLFNNQLVPCIQELHPYDLPEIIALPILAGEKNYLNWLIEEAFGE